MVPFRKWQVVSVATFWAFFCSVLWEKGASVPLSKNSEFSCPTYAGKHVTRMVTNVLGKITKHTKS